MMKSYKEPGFLPDINFWLGLSFEKHPFRRAAVNWWKQRGKDSPVFFNRATQQGFLRLSSNPAFLKQYGVEANTNQDALKALKGFLGAPGVDFKPEPNAIDDLWHKLGGLEVAAPHAWMDAFLAAFAIRAGLQIVTFDTGFKKYEREGLSLLVLEPETKSA